jgi:hypothetical protein
MESDRPVRVVTEDGPGGVVDRAAILSVIAEAPPAPQVVRAP